MYKKIINFLFNALAVKQYLIFSATFFVLTAFVMLILSAQLIPAGCPDTLSLELAFTKSAFNEILSQCGSEGVRSHLVMIWVDFIFIFSYTGFLANLLGSLLRRIDRNMALSLFSLPLIAGVLDAVENILLLIQLQNTDNLSAVLIFLASAAAALKFILICITILLIIFYLLASKIRAGNKS